VSRERNSIAMQRFVKSHVVPNSHDSSGSGVGGIVQPRARTQALAPAFATRERVPRAATHTHVGARGRCCLVHPDPAVSSRLSFPLSLTHSLSPSLSSFELRLLSAQASQPRSASAVLAPSDRQHVCYRIY